MDRLQVYNFMSHLSSDNGISYFAHHIEQSDTESFTTILDRVSGAA